MASVVDVELDELLHRDEGVVLEQDGGGALQHAVGLGVVADDPPQLDAVRLRELDEAQHVDQGVGAAVAGAPLVDADAPRLQALSESPQGRRERVRGRSEGDGASRARQCEEVLRSAQAGRVADRGLQDAIEKEGE